MNKFIDYCMPKKNLVYERFVVLIHVTRNQGTDNWTVYVTELRTKAQKL